MLFAGFGAAPHATLDLDVIHYREVSLVGSEWIGTPPNQRRERYADALGLITSGQVPVARLVSGEVGLDGIEGAYAQRCVSSEGSSTSSGRGNASERRASTAREWHS